MRDWDDKDWSWGWGWGWDWDWDWDSCDNDKVVSLMTIVEEEEDFSITFSSLFTLLLLLLPLLLLPQLSIDFNFLDISWSILFNLIKLFKIGVNFWGISKKEFSFIQSSFLLLLSSLLSLSRNKIEDRFPSTISILLSKIWEFDFDIIDFFEKDFDRDLKRDFDLDFDLLLDFDVVVGVDVGVDISGVSVGVEINNDLELIFGWEGDLQWE